MKSNIAHLANQKIQEIVTKIKNVNKIELFFFFIIMSLITYTHSLNMFNFPAYHDDEGTYMSQAWAITHLNKLAPYTYWYDHAPLGWMVLGFVSILMGGYNTFGDAVSTGRVIILLMHLVSTVVLIFTVKKMTNNIWAGYLSALLFSCLPLFIGYQRKVLLDNILVFFLSFSIFLIAGKKITIKNAIFSGLILGLAVLCKESGIFFVFGILYLVLTGLSKNQKLLGIINWLGFFGSTVALYLVLAISKTELYPSSDKVSLIGTLAFQASRGNGLPFWLESSEFRSSFNSWINSDLISMITLISIFLIGILLTFFNLKNRYFVATILLILGYFGFLLRGKIVIDFYVIPFAYPFSILFGLIYDNLSSFIIYKFNFKKLKYHFNLTTLIIIIIFSIFLQFKINSIAFVRDENSTDREMISWVRKNISKDSKIIINCSLFGDFRYPTNNSDIYQNADWYWKADRDPDVRIKKYNNNPESIDYLLVSGGYLNFFGEGLPFLDAAYQESKEIKKFSNQYAETIIFKIIKDKKKILNNTWLNFKLKYLKYDHIIENEGVITSKNQKYGLIQSIMNDDFDSFDKIWKYTKKNLQRRESDKLLVSKLNESNVSNVVIDSQVTIDSDTDIAYSLLLATQKWGIKEFAEEAKAIIQDLWKLRVTSINNKLVMLPDKSNINEGYELINIANFSPAQYKSFKTIDPSNNWELLASDSYKITKEILEFNKLLPNYIKYNYESKKFMNLEGDLNLTKNIFNSDVANYYTKVNLDNLINNNYSESKFISDKNLEFFSNEFQTKRFINTTYDTSGNMLEPNESTAMDSGILSLFSFSNSRKKGELWRAKFIDKIDLNNQTFDLSNSNFEDQNLGPISFAIKEKSTKEFEKYESLIK